LISLLEEDPTLSIYEADHPLFFYAPKASIRPVQGINEVEQIEIAPNFRLFITCRDRRKPSPALRSRCFWVQIESTTEAQFLFELSETVLSRSLTTASYSRPLSYCLASLFAESMTLHKDRPLVFSKDTFSPHRMINCARGLANGAVTSESTSKRFRMSFVNCYRNPEDTNLILAQSKDIVRTTALDPLPDAKSGWGDLILQAGRFAFALIRSVMTGEDWQKTANARLTQLFAIHHKGEDRSRELPDSDRKLLVSDSLTRFEETLLAWVGNMSLGDIQKTIGLLNEVIFVVTNFTEFSEQALHSFFHVLIMQQLLQRVGAISVLRIAQGEILCQKKIEMTGFIDFEDTDANREKMALAIASIQQMQANIGRILSTNVPLASTVGANLSSKVHPSHNRTILIHMRDTATHERHRAIRLFDCRGADIALMQ
jgi:hypothetical protein